MTKAGDKLLQGAREALAVARGDPDVIKNIKVTPSCGCVFCDVGLRPNAAGLHATEKGAVRCGRRRA